MIKTFVCTLDDEIAFSEALTQLLLMTGEDYAIEAFTTGVEFMKRLDINQGEIDIAIIDINVPNFNIISAVEKLSYTFPKTYIIVVSGDDDAELITKLCNYYDVKYVLKGKQNTIEQLTALVTSSHVKVQKRKHYEEEALRLLEEEGKNGC